ncbi:MAG: membrane protein insertion efficiency factor YidD, partial [Candidatus Berkelbacteria bacterium]|nr:membrane protein insertion efficiency factor YidD [Candidatus Berkelbacteria bacterium]
MIKTISNIIKFPFLALIRLYQMSFSPDHSYISRYFPYGYCRFCPTCSEYTYQAIDKYGIFRGGMKGF